MLYPNRYVYIYNDEASKEYTSMRRCVSRGADRIRSGGSLYAVGVEGEVGRKRTFQEAKDRVRELLTRYPYHKITMRAFEGDTKVDQVRFMGMSTEPPLQDTQGVVGIDRFVTWIENEVKQGRLTSRRYAGICVCKSTAAGGHSDHADCAAIDVFGTNADMATMRDTSIREADYFNTKYSILFKEIWFPGGEHHYYTGTFHAHLHLSVTGGIYNSAC